MKIKEAASKIAVAARSNRTLTRMLVAFVVGGIIVAMLFKCGT